MNRTNQSARWHTRTLGDLFRIKHGFAFKGEYFSSAGPHVVLTPGNFYEEGGFRLKGDKEKYYTGPVPREFVLKRRDLLVVMTEQMDGLLGSPAIIPEDERYLHNQRLGLIVDLDEATLDKGFLYYLFNYRDIRAQIRATANGAKVRHTSPSRIGEVKATLPPLPDQRKIAAVLSAYDDLIENNARRLRILEHMAQALYREWFINFRFPGHDKVRPVDSPLGKIPEGWEARPIGEVVETLGGATPSTKNAEYWHDGDVIWFTPSDLTAKNSMFISDSSKKITARGLEQSSARMFPPYSVMMTSRATIGVTAINTFPACTNQGFITCIPNDRISVYQLYYWIEENKDQIISVASGATYKEINRTEFREFMITIPDRNTTALFVRVVAPIGKQIENLLSKIANLRATRDLLLPKLISGEIDVSAIDIGTGGGS